MCDSLNALDDFKAQVKLEVIEISNNTPSLPEVIVKYRGEYHHATYLHAKHIPIPGLVKKVLSLLPFDTFLGFVCEIDCNKKKVLVNNVYKYRKLT